MIGHIRPNAHAILESASEYQKLLHIVGGQEISARAQTREKSRKNQMKHGKHGSQKSKKKRSKDKRGKK